MKVSSLRRKTLSRSWGGLVHHPCWSPFSADRLPQMNQGRSGPPSSQVQEEGGQRRLRCQETIFILRFWLLTQRSLSALGWHSGKQGLLRAHLTHGALQPERERSPESQHLRKQSCLHTPIPPVFPGARGTSPAFCRDRTRDTRPSVFQGGASRALGQHAQRRPRCLEAQAGARGSGWRWAGNGQREGREVAGKRRSLVCRGQQQGGPSQGPGGTPPPSVLLPPRLSPDGAPRLGPGRELCPVSRAEGSRVVAGTGCRVLCTLCLCFVRTL